MSTPLVKREQSLYIQQVLQGIDRLMLGLPAIAHSGIVQDGRAWLPGTDLEGEGVGPLEFSKYTSQITTFEDFRRYQG